MRPSLTVILIVVALLVSFLIGLFMGGGPLVWWRSISGGGVNNENVTAVLEPVRPTVSPPTELPPSPTTTTPPSTPRLRPTASTTSVAPQRSTATLVPTETSLPVASPTVELPDPSPEPDTTAVVVTIVSAGLYLRNSPSSEGDIIATLTNGMQAIALQRSSDGWLEVEVSELAVQGWLYASPTFVAIEGNPESLPLLNS